MMRNGLRRLPPSFCEGAHVGDIVAVGGIPTLAVGREFVEQARTVQLEVTLEQAA